MVRCHVKGCRRTARKDKEHHFFRLPQNPQVCRKWQEFAQTEECSPHFRICSDHFEPKCIRKKHPRPLLTREAVPTMLPNHQQLGDTTRISHDETLEFQRPALQAECAHHNNDIVMDVTKATGKDPAVIEIQTNNKIRIIIKEGDRECTDGKRSLPPDTVLTSQNLSCMPSTIESTSSAINDDPTRTSPSTTGYKSSCLSPIVTNKSSDTPASLRISTPQRPEIDTITSTPTKKSASHSPKLFKFKTPQGGKLARNVLLTPKSLRLSTQRRTIAQLRSKIQRLKKRTKNIGLTQRNIEIETLIVEASKHLSKEAHTFFASHLRLSNVKMSRRRYNDELKDIALSIKYHSPKAYRFLRKFINLPSERTLSEYQRKFPIYPGVNHTILNQLKTNFQDLPIKDRVVSILFDEIHLTPEIHYDPHSDSFKGIVDDGITREPKEARTALVAMITWVNKPMKQAVGYWLLGKTGNSAKTHQIMLYTTEKIFGIGLIVKCLISDQGSRNVGLLRKVGVTTTNPFFKLPGIAHKIFVVFDPPHLLKSVRNNVRDKRLYYRGGVVDWNEICEVYTLSKEKPLNLIPKVRDDHFNLCKSGKMKVSFAAQILSESMYTAHLVYRTMFPERFKGKDDRTGEFISDMDKLFDSLNSRLEKKSLPNKLNYAIAKDSEHRNFLLNMLGNLEKCKFEKGSIPPCITGLQLTVNTVIQLSDDLRENYDIPVLKTRRLNQDPLENLFATIRQQNGCSIYPSPMQFETGLRHLFITQLTKVSNATNCETDDNQIFAKLSNIQASSAQPTDSSPKYSTEMNPYTNNLESEINNTETADFTETNAVYYISGYLASKFMKLHDCEICRNRLILAESSNSYSDYKLFTIMKNYANTSGLQFSTGIFFESVLKWDRKFQVVIRNLLHVKGISNTLNTILRQECSSFELCSPETTDLLLNTFIRIRCHWEARFLRRKLASGVGKSDQSIIEGKTCTTAQKREARKMKKFL